MNFSNNPCSNLYGLEVHIDDSLYDLVWEFPERRFVQWEAKDESWARKLGFGREVKRPRMEIYQVGYKLYMNQEMCEVLKKRCVKEPDVKTKINPKTGNMSSVYFPGGVLVKAYYE